MSPVSVSQVSTFRRNIDSSCGFCTSLSEQMDVWLRGTQQWSQCVGATYLASWLFLKRDFMVTVTWKHHFLTVIDDLQTWNNSSMVVCADMWSLLQSQEVLMLLTQGGYFTHRDCGDIFPPAAESWWHVCCHRQVTRWQWGIIHSKPKHLKK